MLDSGMSGRHAESERLTRYAVVKQDSDSHHCTSACCDAPVRPCQLTSSGSGAHLRVSYCMGAPNMPSHLRIQQQHPDVFACRCGFDTFRQRRAKQQRLACLRVRLYEHRADLHIPDDTPEAMREWTA